jgi:GrpB-like predicted nucleotidyltransferase (UPF0157 family)
MLGMPSGCVQLSQYTLEWRTLFLEEEARLKAHLGGYLLDVQHIGGTSIPGMPAKPILDIGVAVKNFEEAARSIPPMEQLGFAYKGENGVPRRHYFVKGDPRTHHAHMFEIESDDKRMPAVADLKIHHE